jgi:type II secretory pathway pseudopilin PulG
VPISLGTHEPPMRHDHPWNRNRATRRRAGGLRALASSQSGFTIIEVVVSAIMLVTISGAAATALIATNNFSSEERHRSQADELAQQDQERMKGMSAKTLAGYSWTRTVTYDGTDYQLKSTGKFLSNTGNSSCGSSGNGAAAYVKIRSEADWIDGSGNAHWTYTGRVPVVQESLITPPTGGTILVKTKDQNNAPLAGVSVTATGPDTQTASTDDDGCVVLAAMDVGDYALTLGGNFVDVNGVQAADIPIPSTAVSGTGTSFPIGSPFQLGVPGLVSGFFRTQFAAGDVRTDQKGPAMSWFNAGMTNGSQRNTVSLSGSPAVRTPATSLNTTGPPWTLFPFNNGTSGDYTNNYQVWAGSCDSDQPPSANRTYASVGPSGWAIINGANGILEPSLKIRISYATTGAYVTPAHLKLTDSCGLTWSPAIRATDLSAGSTGTGTQGHLAFPGQPYSSSYNVCVDYDPPGAVTSRVVTTTTTNTNFTTATTKDILLTDTSPGGTCANETS